MRTLKRSSLSKTAFISPGGKGVGVMVDVGVSDGVMVDVGVMDGVMIGVKVGVGE